MPFRSFAHCRNICRRPGGFVLGFERLVGLHTLLRLQTDHRKMMPLGKKNRGTPLSKTSGSYTRT